MLGSPRLGGLQGLVWLSGELGAGGLDVAGEPAACGGVNGEPLQGAAAGLVGGGFGGGLGGGFGGCIGTWLSSCFNCRISSWITALC